MVRDSRYESFDYVLVHKLDRFARNRYDSAFYKRELKLNNVEVISILEQLDNSPESIILESVLEGMAEYYSANLSREVMKGMRETAYACKHNGGKAPLGYDVAEDKTYIINPHEAEAVKIIFYMYSEGFSYGEIINRLNLLGHKTKLGNKFGKNSLYDILNNEKYRGLYVFNKSSKKVNGKRNNRKYKPSKDIIMIEDGMPRIITDSMWKEVQKRMVESKRTNASNKAKELYLLSGIVECGNCGGAMVGNRRTSGRNKTVYSSYECSTRKRLKTCDMKEISKEFLENTVVESLINEILSLEGIEKLSVRLHEYASSQISEIKTDLKFKRI